MKIPMYQRFIAKGKDEFGNTQWEDNSEWLGYNNRKTLWLKNKPYGYSKYHDASGKEVGDWLYDRYLEEYYDCNFAEKPIADCFSSKSQWEAKFYSDILSEKNTMSFDDYKLARDKFYSEHEEKVKQSKLRRIANSKEQLTITEKFLVYRTHVDRRCHNEDGAKDLKTTKELRATLGKLRQSKRYPDLKALDKKLRGGLTIMDFLIRGKAKNISWEEMRLLQHSVSAVHKLAVAENDIEGLSDNEIESLALLETL